LVVLSDGDVVSGERSIRTGRENDLVDIDLTGTITLGDYRYVTVKKVLEES
jgi:hypothetical protein